MNRVITNTYNDLSARAADDLLHILQTTKNPLICTASGASPAGLYQELVRRVNEEQIDFSNWYFVGLDEWIGLNGTDEGSSRDMLNQQLFFPLQLPERQVCFFDGKAADREKECERVEDFIRQQGGITVAILGIGVNGHIGMNEPGTPPHLRSHVAALHPQTQQIGQKYFKQPRKLEAGLTLGLATLLEAKHLMLLASGPSKTEIMAQLFQAPVSEALPATFLKNHPGLRVYVDKAAGALLA